MKNEVKMDDLLNVDKAKIKKIMQIKLDYLNGTMTMSEAKEAMHASFEQVTAQEFALCEQALQSHGISDDVLAERMEEILEIFDGLLVSEKIELPEGHPIRTYLDEVQAIRKLLAEIQIKKNAKFIKNQWLEIYENLEQIGIHFSRKQNQLYPALERAGFDKPSKVMWTLENKIKEKIRNGKALLNADNDEAFLEIQDDLIQTVEDMMVKEVEILYPTALDLISEDAFVIMRTGDDEIGYCLIENPKPFGQSNQNSFSSNPTDGNLLKDLANLLQKHQGILSPSTEPDDKKELNVSQGSLTLEQINLIFKHLQVDLSYVDEHEIFKFYSATKHRVFPRSPGAIGRDVQNCHPRESVHLVEEIIRAFKAGEQDQAEFWLEMGDKFIYIIYNAVRDDAGNFRGVLEMMQDATHIRSLTGSQRLLSWEKKEDKVEETISTNVLDETAAVSENKYGITKDSIIGDLVKKYPFVKDFMLSLSPKFAKLSNPILFKTMSSIATIEMISQRGNLEVQDVIDKICLEIESRIR